MTKYGKIYNKRKSNYNAIAMVYQSSGSCKMQNQLQCKSVGKPCPKKMPSFNQKTSPESMLQKEMLHKTQWKSFCIEDNQNKGTNFNESQRKATHGNGWKSTHQLPFLLITQRQPEQKTSVITKKKPHISIQKTNSHSTTSNTRNSNVPGFHRR